VSVPSVVVHPTARLLAAATAARLVTALLDAQAARGHAHLVLTGGGTGVATLAATAACPARCAVDWSAVDIWWGDERFLPSGHPDRNATQARAALLDAVPVHEARVHEMAASGGPHGRDPDSAASAYAADLAAASPAGEDTAVPAFDVLLLGVGPDGHVASLFPGLRGVRQREGTVIGVRDSPKPPPDRVSLTLPAINTARHVWLLATGPSKAEAVRLALAPIGGTVPPAGLVRGRLSTVWLLDEAAAGSLPAARGGLLSE
jgi:6-phosphogluconolactonase